MSSLSPFSASFLLLALLVIFDTCIFHVFIRTAELHILLLYHFDPSLLYNNFYLLKNFFCIKIFFNNFILLERNIMIDPITSLFDGHLIYYTSEFLLSFLNLFIFNWRIIALHNCAGSCHTST